MKAGQLIQYEVEDSLRQIVTVGLRGVVRALNAREKSQRNRMPNFTSRSH